ncbi:hypothetical protein ACPV5U_08560 [Vibrio mediterranei]
MSIEDENNQDHLDIDEDAVFKTAVSEMTGELTGEPSGDTDIPNNDLEENGTEPLGQVGDELVNTPDGEQEDDELERLRADNARLTHSLSSEKGRSRAAQKRWQETQQKLQQVSQNLPGNPEGVLDDDFRENFPELAEALENGMAKSAEKTNEAIKATLDPMQSLVDGELESLNEQQQEAAELAVTDAVPDAHKILANPEFNTWLNSQPVGVQGLFDSDNPEDAIYLLNQFKERPSPGREIQSRREKQKRSLNTAAGRKAPPKSGSDIDDEDAMWASISKQVHKDFGRG